MTLTKEWLQKTISQLEEERDATPGAVNEDAAKALAAMKRALASLEAEAVGYIDAEYAELLTSGHIESCSVYADPGEGCITLFTAPPAPVSVPDDIDARMKNAGMLSAAEIIAGQPIDAFMKHAGVVDLASLLKWAEMRRAEFLRMQAKYELGDSPKDDMYEWVISHVAAFSELHVNIRAAMLQGADGNSPVIPDGWIPVSDRLPESKPGSYEYIVFETLNNRAHHDYWNVPDRGDDAFTPFWNHYGKYVTHWQPLPAAPQQEV